jgi:hypothetical protein
VLVGDCAYPLSFDNGDPYPKEMVAVGGYLGGDTPHVWTDLEIAQVRHSNRLFWPIWTAPNSRTQRVVLTGAIGAADGRAMAAALQARSIPQSTPVFYDVEHSTYENDPAGAKAALSAFKREVYAAGWPNVFAYAPKDFNRDWVAWWTNVRPTALPVDWVGQQFGGKPGVDFSIFDLEKLGVVEMQVDLTDSAIEAVRAAVSGTFQSFIRAELSGSEQRLVTLLSLTQQEAGDVAAIKAKLATFGTPDSTMTPDEEHAFAVELSKVLGTALSTAT